MLNQWYPIQSLSGYISKNTVNLSRPIDLEWLLRFREVSTAKFPKLYCPNIAHHWILLLILRLALFRTMFMPQLTAWGQANILCPLRPWEAPHRVGPRKTVKMALKSAIAWMKLSQSGRKDKEKSPKIMLGPEYILEESRQFQRVWLMMRLADAPLNSALAAFWGCLFRWCGALSFYFISSFWPILAAWFRLDLSFFR
jgi:hypothetical protein